MIYADNAATTSVHEGVLQAMLPFFSQTFGNPGAQHAAGRAAAEAVRTSRELVAKNLGCDPREVIFCSSGSEADNQALRTAVTWGAARGRKQVVTSAFEHPAILRTLEVLEREQGIEVVRVRPDGEGLVRPADVASAVGPATCLVSVMAVNNEVGTVQPVEELAGVAHKAGALFHTDAVQGAGHISLDVHAMGLDMLSLSAHKFHGPKGVGALICASQALGEPLEAACVIHGGHQERGRRAATENVPGIVGLAVALDEACGRLQQDAAYIGWMRNRLIEGLTAIPGSHLMGSLEHRNPGTVNVCFEGANREALVALLDERGICASAGAACESGATGVSPVLQAMGVPRQIAAGALRLSLGCDNTPEEVEVIIAEVGACVDRLRAAAAEEF